MGGWRGREFDIGMTDQPLSFSCLIFRRLRHAGFVLLVGLACAWAAAALSLQLAGVVEWLCLAALALAGGVVLALRFRQPGRAWAVFLISALAVAGWYQTLQPRQDRNWAPDVAHGVSARLEGNIATLENVRNFAWSSADAAVPRWETRRYDLDQLQTVDMITSTWGDPDIAHLIVSFGFADGQRVAFSVEIRKELGESFSSIGGFFRQFELALIAADENDIVRLRTNLRGEDVHLFPVKLNADQRRVLFLSYVNFGNQLAARPEFYNTVTANCASTVYTLVKVIKPDMPLDSRLLFSGQLPEYIDELGGLQGDGPMAERRVLAAISAKARAAAPDADFSAVIRR
jgi:Domain of unknown function (DUF4105)